LVEIKVSAKIRIGNRYIIVKEVSSLISIMKDATIEGTADQLRIMAFGMRDLMIDKLLAYKPIFGEPVLKLQQDDIKIRGKKRYVPEEAPDEQRLDIKTREELMLEARNLLPQRTLGRPVVKRLPYRRIIELSEKYVKDKVRKKLDPRMLMATGEYIRGIMVKKVKTKDAGVFYKVAMARRNHASGISLDHLARIIEYGTSSFTIKLFGDENNVHTMQLPPRKHWKPAFKEILETRVELGRDLRLQKLEEKLLALK